MNKTRGCSLKKILEHPPKKIKKKKKNPKKSKKSEKIKLTEKSKKSKKKQIIRKNPKKLS